MRSREGLAAGYCLFLVSHALTRPCVARADPTAPPSPTVQDPVSAQPLSALPLPAAMARPRAEQPARSVAGHGATALVNW